MLIDSFILKFNNVAADGGGEHGDDGEDEGDDSDNGDDDDGDSNDSSEDGDDCNDDSDDGDNGDVRYLRSPDLSIISCQPSSAYGPTLSKVCEVSW